MNIDKLCKVSPYLGDLFQKMMGVQKASDCGIGCLFLTGFRNLAYVKMIEELGLITAEWISVDVDEKDEDAPCRIHVHFMANKGSLKRLRYNDVMEICWGTDWQETGNRS